jgi:hypothetical protein
MREQRLFCAEKGNAVKIALNGVLEVLKSHMPFQTAKNGFLSRVF